MAEKELVYLLLDLDKSPFEHQRADIFLDRRKKEINTIELYMENRGAAGTGIVVEEDSSSEGNDCRINFEFNVEFILPVLPEDDVVTSYLEKQQQDESEKWYNDREAQRKSGLLYKNFVDFFKLNNNNKHVCFIVVLTKAQNDEESRVEMFGPDPNWRTENFRIPPKIFPTGVIDVSHDKIEYWVDYHDGIMTHIEIQYTEMSYHDNDSVFQTITQQVLLDKNTSTQISLSDLKPGTNYRITQKLISIISDIQWAVGPKSDELVITTSSSFPPSDLSISSKRETEVVLNLMSPSYVTSVEYKVDVHEKSCSNVPVNSTTSTLKTSIALQYLTPNTTYCISVVGSINIESPLQCSKTTKSIVEKLDCHYPLVPKDVMVTTNNEDPETCFDDENWGKSWFKCCNSTWNDCGTDQTCLDDENSKNGFKCLKNECPPEYERISGSNKCYSFFDIKMSWVDAHAFCAKELVNQLIISNIKLPNYSFCTGLPGLSSQSESKCCNENIII